MFNMTYKSTFEMYLQFSFAIHKIDLGFLPFVDNKTGQFIVDKDVNRTELYNGFLKAYFCHFLNYDLLKEFWDGVI